MAPPTGSRPASAWTGRLSLKVDSEPPQAVAASFELRGHAGDGSLQLTSPLGVSIARMSWSAQAASLESEGRTQTFGSVRAMTRQLTGTDLPLEALFDWLEGRAGRFGEWLIEQDERTAGRLRLRRKQPAPEVELRLIVD